MPAYIQQNRYARYLSVALLARPGLLEYVMMFDGDLVGESGITIPLYSRPILSRVNCDFLPSGRASDSNLLEAEQWAAYDCLTRKQYNDFINDRDRRVALLDAWADAFRLQMEDALNDVLQTSTNTYSLDADNDPDPQEVLEAMMEIDEGGGNMSDLVILTRAEFASNLVANGADLAGGTVSGLGRNKRVAGYFYGAPIVLSSKLEVSAATGGTAAVIWDPRGVVGAVADIDFNLTPTKTVSKAAWEMGADGFFGFALTEGAGDTRVKRIVNP